MRVGAVVKRRVQLDGGRARPVPRAFAGLNEVMAAEQHDACVGKTSITDNVCHQSLNQCLDIALKANSPVWKKVEGQPGPQNKCKAKMLVKTMSEGMNLASMFGEMFGGMNSINMGEL